MRIIPSENDGFVLVTLDFACFNQLLFPCSFYSSFMVKPPLSYLVRKNSFVANSIISHFTVKWEVFLQILRKNF